MNIIPVFPCDRCGHHHFWINMSGVGEGEPCRVCKRGIQLATLLYTCSYPCTFESLDQAVVESCERSHETVRNI